MLGLVRQPLLKSVKIAQFGVKKFAQPIPRVLKKSYSQRGSYPGYKTASDHYFRCPPLDDVNKRYSGRVARMVNFIELKPVNQTHYCWGDALRARGLLVNEGPEYEVLEEHNVYYHEKISSFTDKCIFYQKFIMVVLFIGVTLVEMYIKFVDDPVAVGIHKKFVTQLFDIVQGYMGI